MSQHSQFYNDSEAGNLKLIQRAKMLQYLIIKSLGLPSLNKELPPLPRTPTKRNVNRFSRTMIA